MLKLLNFKNISILSFIIMVGLLQYQFNKINKLEHENLRVKENYNNSLLIDSIQTSVFRFKTQLELEQLLTQNKSLNKLLRTTRVKNSRVEALYYQSQKYIDSVRYVKNVSSLVSSIRKNIPDSKKFKHKTECVSLDGTITYKNDSLNLNIDKTEVNQETLLVRSKGRRKKIKWLLGLRLGKREEKFSAESKCGKVKLQIIEKTK